MQTFFSKPWILLICLLGITTFFAIQIPDIQLDNDVYNFVPEDNPERIAESRTSDIFGETLSIAVALELKHGTIFEPEFIRLVDELSKQIEEIPGVSDVTSLTTTDYIEGTEEGMIVVPLTENYSGTPEETAQLKERLLSWEMYEKSLYSTDFDATQIIIPLNSSSTAEERESIHFSILDILEKNLPPHVKYYIAGTPSLTVLLNNNVRSDLRNLIPLVILILVLTLYLSFKKPGGVILPLATVIMSTTWTIGLMALLGIKLSMVGTVIPVLMVAVGSAYGIHIVSHYYDELNLQNNQISEERHRELVFQTLTRIGKPVLMAGITTIAGFGALSVSEVIPMRHFGIFTAFGVLAALIVALTLIPSILLVRHKALSIEKKNSQTQNLDTAELLMLKLYHFFSKGKGKIIFLTLVITIAGIVGTSLLVKDNVLIEYFKKETDIRQADVFLREKFLGTESFDIVVRGENPGDLTNPDALIAMDKLKEYLLKKHPDVTKVVSFADFVKRMNQVMNIPVEETPEDFSMADDNFGDSEGFSFFEDNEEQEADSGFSFFMEDEPVEYESTDIFEGEAPMSNETAAPSSDTFLEAFNRAAARANSSNLSARELVELVNKEFNYKGSDYYEIPNDLSKYPVETRAELQNLIAQYLLLFSGNMDDWADDAIEPRQVRMMVQMKTTGSIEADKIATDAQHFAEQIFPEGYSVETTGQTKIKYALTQLLINAQTLSIAISLTLVFIIVSINFRSLAAGLFGIIPLALTILVNFGVMGFSGIKLDISTAMVASIAIGIGIDYSIHFMSAYHYERTQTDDLELVAQKSLKGVGKAIMFNAVSVGLGFAVLILSKINPLGYMGILIAVTMAVSGLASLTVLPALLHLIKPKFISRKIEEKV